MKEFPFIKQMHEKSTIFVTIDIFQTVGLKFKDMYATDAMMY